MTITFVKTEMEQALSRYLLYTASLRLIDTYWEEYILQAVVYDILIDDIVIGSFSINSTHAEETLLTSFALDEKYIVLSQEIFAEILADFSPKCGYVVTNDELMLSLCMEYQERIELQAFFFDYTGDTIKSEEAKTDEGNSQNQVLSLATDEDLPELLRLDFFHPLYINYEENLIYLLRNEAREMMGAGHIQRMKLARQYGAVGMIVCEKFRGQSVGKSIITQLKDIVKGKGLIPIAGCRSQNYASKHTLESVGFVTKTRLLKVFFSKE